MTGNRRPLRGLFLALLLATSCGAGEVPTIAAVDAGTVTETARIYLIATEDGGVEGTRVSCGDSAVPVEISLPRSRPALEGSIEALLAMDEDHDTRTGFYNALHGSNLELARVERVGPEVRVHLKGYLELGEQCDGARVLAQLTETAAQFRDVERARFFLEGESLDRLLEGK